MGRSTTMASRTASNCDTSCRLAPVTTSDNATPRPSTSKWRLLPFFPPIRRIGADALLSHWRLYHCTVNTLPSPGNAFKLVVLSETQFAQCLKDPCLLPLQEAGVDCAGTAVALGRAGPSTGSLCAVQTRCLQIPAGDLWVCVRPQAFVCRSDLQATMLHELRQAQAALLPLL